MSSIKPKSGTLAYVSVVPECDFCGTNHQEALYDFKTKMGPWAFGCEAHYVANRAHPELGIGKGQKLVLRVPLMKCSKCEYVLPKSEVSDIVREAHQNCGEFVTMNETEVDALLAL